MAASQFAYLFIALYLYQQGSSKCWDTEYLNSRDACSAY